MYFSKIAEHGVLAVHTSNRHVDLVKPVSDVAVALDLKYRVGNDLSRERKGYGEMRGFTTSQWVMLSRHEEDLPPHGTREEMDQYDRAQHGEGEFSKVLWFTPRAPGNRVWTDDYSNLLGVFRW
jgi:hypothetical protein